MATIINAKGIITSYRRSRHKIHPTQILCKFNGFDSNTNASQLIGHELAWTSKTGKLIRGKITKTHGKNGVVRVKLIDQGIPGQAIGDQVKIVK